MKNALVTFASICMLSFSIAANAVIYNLVDGVVSACSGLIRGTSGGAAGTAARSNTKAGKTNEVKPPLILPDTIALGHDRSWRPDQVLTREEMLAAKLIEPHKETPEQ